MSNDTDDLGTFDHDHDGEEEAVMVDLVSLFREFLDIQRAHLAEHQTPTEPQAISVEAWLENLRRNHETNQNLKRAAELFQEEQNVAVVPQSGLTHIGFSDDLTRPKPE